ncbi:tetratricopeptide repeat-containing sensor histidine kinase [Proteiniphilum acetatigenes]|uniref:tetratricopeptide repeat-containing sensor histidine kinase n=1 Tax=Proteiniphilum acetatigenes TaxID=294710 RepID=UPI000367B4EC|nr:sensor histidine kinase [Proteiniphilum acetatigenes]
MKNLAFILLLLAACVEAHGQNIDSLLRAARVNPDTAVINRLYEIGYEVEMRDHGAAKRIYRTAGELSEEIDYPMGRIRFASNYTYLLNLEGKLDSSLTINLKALELAREIGNEERINVALVNIGNVYHYKRLYNTALEYYIRALPWFEKAGNRKNLATLYDVIQVFYQRTERPEQGIVYGKKALELMKDYPDDIIRGHILINLASLYSNCVPRRWEEHLECLKEALRIAEATDYIDMKASVLNNLGNYYLQKFDYKTAELYGQEALVLHDSIGDMTGYLVSLRGLALCNLQKGDYEKAEAYAQEALILAQEQEWDVEERKCYQILADLALLKDRDYVKSQKLIFKFDSLGNEILNDNIWRANEELKIKYETEQKEFQIATLNERHKSTILIGIIGGAALVSGVLALLFLWLWTKQKRRKTELQLKQLEQEKQLVATRSVLEGEMQERSRLARDLHDGLGGILSAAKINMSELKNGALLEFPDVEGINRIMGLLDESLRELRRVAHHLMPESLSRYGLKTALSDFCRTVEKIEFAWFGEEERLEHQLEIVVYRIVHELVNNALKYSEATRILVHIVQDRDRISLTVEDNGKGFDISAATTGTGLQNIRTRVAALEGNMDIFSTENEGTEVHVELKIKADDTGTDS